MRADATLHVTERHTARMVLGPFRSGVAYLVWMWCSTLALIVALGGALQGVLRLVSVTWVVASVTVVLVGGVSFLCIASHRHRRVEGAVARSVGIGEMCRMEFSGVMAGQVDDETAQMLREVLDVPLGLAGVLVVVSSWVCVFAVWYLDAGLVWSLLAVAGAVSFDLGWVKVVRGLSWTKASMAKGA